VTYLKTHNWRNSFPVDDPWIPSSVEALPSEKKRFVLLALENKRPLTTMIPLTCTERCNIIYFY